MTNAPLEKRFAHFLTEISANLISILGKSELDARVIAQRFPRPTPRVLAHIGTTT